MESSASSPRPPSESVPKVVCAFDKFRGSATAEELVIAAVEAAEALGWLAIGVPLSDGGEGALSVVGGPNKRTRVSGPLGDQVEAQWRLDGDVAFIEMAEASGLSLAGGVMGNDPLAADTRGTGELITKAVELGARTVYVLLGGSATTDGGWGAIQTMPPRARLLEVDLVACCDVRTLFGDAASVFGPQKGASKAQVQMLERRLSRLAQVYRSDYATDIRGMPGAGAAGGLAGGICAMGGRIESGFDVLAEWVDLDVHLADADLVITGEGLLDSESFNGKVVGGVADWARHHQTPVLAIVGDSMHEQEAPPNVSVVSLTERYGLAESLDRTLELVAEAVTEYLAKI